MMSACIPIMIGSLRCFKDTKNYTRYLMIENFKIVYHLFSNICRCCCYMTASKVLLSLTETANNIFVHAFAS